MTSPTTPRDAIGLSERLRRAVDPFWHHTRNEVITEAATQLDALQERVKELEAADRYANLISIIADIREKSGLGGKPMLNELAYAVEAKIEAAESRALRAEHERDEAYERAAGVVDGAIAEFDDLLKREDVKTAPKAMECTRITVKAFGELGAAIRRLAAGD